MCVVYVWVWYLCVCVPGDADERHFLAAAVVDQGHAHILEGEDDFLRCQLGLLALTQLPVDPALLGEQRHPLEALVEGDEEELALFVHVHTLVL